MSGIELAGLVLGAFPILLAALESYREGAEVLKDWWQIQRAFKKCKHELNYHRTIFEGNIERLLLPLVVDEDELKDLMDNPAGQGWENQNLETRLKDRLPKSYSLFVDTMRHINTLMDSLKKELGISNPQFQSHIDKHGKRPKHNSSGKDLLRLSNIEFQAKRIKFSLKKSSRESLFAQFKEANDQMRNLLENNDQLVAARKDRDARKLRSTVDQTINTFYEHASRLHGALSKAWRCACPAHMATLQLQHRTSLTRIKFDVFFDVRSSLDVGGWRPTKIEMLKDDDATPVGTPINSPQQVAAQGASEASQAMQNILTAHNYDSSTLKEIDCLCSTLSEACSGCFGFLDEDDHRFAVFPADQTIVLPRVETVTLERILCDTHTTLTRRKRYWLALTLASSYLQLNSTPWLNTPLQLDSIYFFRDPTDNESLIVEAPYICSNMSRNGVATRNDTMPSLGIRLLELCFGTSLNNVTFRQLLPPGDATSAPFLDYAAAVQWSKLVPEEAGPEFSDAVDWCLHNKELNTDSWRHEVWQRVIVPLDYCYQQLR